MRKSDLKTGMIVVLRCGNEYKVFREILDACYMVSISGAHYNMNCLEEDMTNTHDSVGDIMEVYVPTSPEALTDWYLDSYKLKYKR